MKISECRNFTRLDFGDEERHYPITDSLEELIISNCSTINDFVGIQHLRLKVFGMESGMIKTLNFGLESTEEATNIQDSLTTLAIIEYRNGENPNDGLESI